MISGPCGLAPVSFSAPRSCRPNAGAPVAGAAVRSAAGDSIRDRNPASNRARLRPAGWHEGAGRRQNRNLPKPLVRDCLRRDTHTQISDTHSRAYSSKSTESWSSVHLLSQTRKAFTSVSLLIPALSASSVTKKPHIPLNGAGHLSTVQPSCAACRHYIGGDPSTEISMTSKAIGKCNKKWRNLALAACLALTLCGRPARPLRPTSRT